MAAREGWNVHLVNAVNAYVGSKLDKEIYIEVPEGVEATKGMVCLILQSLYGLKQSVFLWNRKV